MQHYVPKWSYRFLRWYCNPDLLEEIEGDLFELHRKRLAEYGNRKAGRQFTWDVIRFFRWSNIKRSETYYPKSNMGLISNYILTAFRGFRKQKLITGINLVGLSIGIACTLMIFLYMKREFSYDQFHANKDLIYRVYRIEYNPDKSIESRTNETPEPLGAAILEDFPELETAIRMETWGPFHYIKSSDRSLEQQILFADPGLFTEFDFPLQYGSKLDVFNDQNSIVLTQSAAEKYFGTTDVLGRTLQVRLFEEFEDFIVSGVAIDPPANSSLQFEVVVSFDRMLKTFPWTERDIGDWGSSGYKTYVKSREPLDIASLENRLFDFFHSRHGWETSMRADGTWKGDHHPFRYGLIPLQEIHMAPFLPEFTTEPIDPFNVRMLALIAVMILLIACFNFAILSVGRAGNRSREIGLRKTIGAIDKQIRFQFWSESLMMVIMAGLLGVGITVVMLPTFNELTSSTLMISDLLDLEIAPWIVLVLLLTAFLAGAYPSILLSRLNPIAALKKKLNIRRSPTLTRGIVVVQFTISTVFIIMTLIIHSQIDYMRNKDLGFNGDQIVVVPLGTVDREKLPVYREQISGHSSIVGLTGSNNAFPRDYSRIGWVWEEKIYEPNYMPVEAEFIDLMDIELVAGRNFDPLKGSDSLESIIINEAFAEMLGYEDPIGQPLKGFERKGMQEPTIIGMVKDFNFKNLKNAVDPVLLTIHPGDPSSYLLIKIKPEDYRGTIDMLSMEWNKLFAEVPLDFWFLDEEMDHLYAAEERWGQIFMYSALLAILIAFMGLYGLAMLTISTRLKEVSIRRVIGGSFGNIMMILSREFILLIIISFVIAIPISNYLKLEWMEQFAYKSPLGPGIFALGVVIVAAVAGIAVGQQALKAASTNPASILKSEE